MNPRSLAELKVNGIDCYGLNCSDQRRIAKVGFWAWLDEVAAGQKPVPRRLRPSRRVKDAVWAGLKRPNERPNQSISAP